MQPSSAKRSRTGFRAARPLTWWPRNWASRPICFIPGGPAPPQPPLGGGGAAGARPGSLADLQAQLEAVLRENRHLREQRDILKKTLGILSEPSPSATN